MASTLKELQDAEYKILCDFADFCDKHSLTYGLSGGTLLGAVRHNGFIPWDDDIDVHMEIHEFKKFLKLYKKNPIKGLHLSWIDTDQEYPFYYAKLRKCGTYMPEEACSDLDMHNGVWIDIFVYMGVPNNKLLAKLQQKLYFVFATTARMYIYNKIDEKSENDAQYGLKYRLMKNMSRKNMHRFRRLLFTLFSSIGSRKSEFVVYNDWSQTPKKKLPRALELPVTKHIFRDREFSVPEKYDEALTTQYGDYMKPVEYPTHTDLTKVQL